MKIPARVAIEKGIIEAIGSTPVDRQSKGDRKALAQLFVQRQIIDSSKRRVQWGEFTGQTIQMKGSRLAEHLVSIVTGFLGRGSTATGGGADLANGEEVKSGNRIGQKGGMTDSHVIISFHNNEDYFESFLRQRRLWFVFFDAVNKRMRVQIWTVNTSSRAAQKEFRDWKRVEHNWEYGKINLRIYQDRTTTPLHPRFARMEPRLIFKAVENEHGEAEVLVFEPDGITPPDIT
jgi:hypothetical protein